METSASIVKPRSDVQSGQELVNLSKLAHPGSGFYNCPMSDYLTNPHDKFFKDLFSRADAARDFLRHYLPSEVTHLLDLATLEISKDSFIDPDLQEHFSDLLYKVTLHTGQESWVYVLFEHKSYPDAQIAFQLLKYMVRIWEQAHKQAQPLLPVLPVVVYHGPQHWRVASQFTALFDLPDALRRYMPEYHYWLCDLSQYSDEEIKSKVESAVILQIGLLLLKYSQRADLGQHLGEILRLLWELTEQQTALEYLETILRYVAGSNDQLSSEELVEAVREVLQEGEDLMPTIAEQWFKEGEVAGFEKGKAAGREEGREAALSLLRRVVAMRFGVELDHFNRAFETLSLEALTKLSDAAFEAKTLSEFEAVLAQLQADFGSP
jgi:predicted transposase/invertase (TIGR01784 family)